MLETTKVDLLTGCREYIKNVWELCDPACLGNVEYATLRDGWRLHNRQVSSIENDFCVGCGEYLLFNACIRSCCGAGKTGMLCKQVLHYNPLTYVHSCWNELHRWPLEKWCWCSSVCAMHEWGWFLFRWNTAPKQCIPKEKGTHHI